ncbi:hypothetical protein FRC01_004952 [Tulasnella sp. 417]|nr:hypothetical protein FRC01_004952 [Tulasnella sp. 417]
MRKAMKLQKRQIQQSVIRTSSTQAESSSPSSSMTNPPATDPIPTVQINTTVRGETSINVVPLKRLHEGETEEVSSHLPGLLSNWSDSAAASASEEAFEEDFVMVEDTPSCLQTDSVNTRSLKNCYPQFLSSTREWKVIKTLMKANSKTGQDLKPGEATVKCGFCPIPGVNIPDSWEDDPEA